MQSNLGVDDPLASVPRVGVEELLTQPKRKTRFSDNFRRPTFG